LDDYLWYPSRVPLDVDIDDTIKVSQVLKETALLYNTFVEPNPKPVTGMPELYSLLQSRLHTPPFFYLSASPWQLYEFVWTFLHRHYPPGTIIMREMTLMQFTSLFSSWVTSPEEYKVSRMQKIHRWLPRRKVICIGDSTQRDPESYAKIYREYGGWIRKIWIHVVEGVDPAEEKKKGLNTMERFEKAFEGIDRSVWTTFRNPEDLVGLIPEA
jgi:phosphatidate phosphatase APP1